MNKSTPSSISQMFKVDYNDPEKIALSNQATLRKIVGILGMALPLLLYGFLYVDIGYNHTLPSISHYYYTRVCSIFVAIMSMLAIFLIIYKGRAPLDFYLSAIAGIFAFCVVLFPTDNIEGVFSVTVLKVSAVRPVFHYVSAAIFLTCLSVLSLFVFTKSDKRVKARGIKKKMRNRLYRTCGGIMLAAILVILLWGINLLGDDLTRFYNDHHLTFWMETIAVESFGLSWLVKGGAMLAD
ncbi:MAG: hypothetical protein ACKOU7_10120 [Ferruginibacter sp.]